MAKNRLRVFKSSLNQKQVSGRKHHHLDQSLTLEELPYDILYLILEELSQISQSSLHRLLLVSRTLYHATAPHAFRTVVFRFGPKPEAEDSTASRPSPSLYIHHLSPPCQHDWPRTCGTTILENVRTIVIEKDRGCAKPIFNIDFELVMEFIRAAVSLRLVKYRGGQEIPCAMIDTLEQCHPAARLEVIRFSRRLNSWGNDTVAEKKLAGSPSLETATMELHGSSYYSCQKAAFSRMLWVAPNLRHIRMGCFENPLEMIVAEQEPWSLGIPMPKPEAQNMPDNIRRIALFHCEPAVRKPVEELKLLAISISLPDYEHYWSRIMDFRKLKILDIWNGFLSKELMRHLIAGRTLESLRYLSITISAEGHHVVSTDCKFIETLPPLKGLALISGMLQHSGFLKSILRRHGKSLELFNVRTSPYQTPPHESRTLLTVGTLQIINEMCPNLQSLTVDVMPIMRISMKRLCGALAKFEQLRYITIRLGYKTPHYREADRAELALRLWRRMAKTKQGRPLREVIVEDTSLLWLVDDWSIGNPLATVEMQNRARWIVDAELIGERSKPRARRDPLNPFDNIHENSFEPSPYEMIPVDRPKTRASSSIMRFYRRCIWSSSAYRTIG